MKFKRSGTIMIIIILVLVVFAGARLATLRTQIDDARAKTDELQERYDELTQENAELAYEIEHSEDPETLESIARSKLGLVQPGEQIFIDLNN